MRPRSFHSDEPSSMVACLQTQLCVVSTASAVGGGVDASRHLIWLQLMCIGSIPCPTFSHWEPVKKGKIVECDGGGHRIQARVLRDGYGCHM